MKTTVKYLYCTLLFSVVSSCSSKVDTNKPDVICSKAWYQSIENVISSSDEQGHGPDLGSSEWRSAIEHKLALKAVAQAPSINSQQWCAYIDAIVNPR